jgi:hypothetical protein
MKGPTMKFKSLSDLEDLLRRGQGSQLPDDRLSGVYLIPESQNWPAHDSMVFHKVGNSYEIHFYQMTISDNHGIKIKYLQELFESLPHRLKEGALSRGGKIYFVFVIPPEIDKDFRAQKFKEGNMVYKGKLDGWVGQMEQAVLVINDNELFGV